MITKLSESYTYTFDIPVNYGPRVEEIQTFSDIANLIVARPLHEARVAKWLNEAAYDVQLPLGWAIINDVALRA